MYDNGGRVRPRLDDTQNGKGLDNAGCTLDLDLGITVSQDYVYCMSEIENGAMGD